MDNQKIYLMAEVTVLPEFLDDVKGALKEALIPTLQEAGCEGMVECTLACFGCQTHYCWLRLANIPRRRAVVVRRFISAQELNRCSRYWPAPHQSGRAESGIQPRQWMEYRRHRTGPDSDEIPRTAHRAWFATIKRI